MAVSNYDGAYHLHKVLDKTRGEEIVLPSMFEVRMDRNDLANEYDWSIKIGNNLSAKVVVVPNETSDPSSAKDSVSCSGIRSTRMMPPKDLYELEVALAGILPATQLIYFDADDREMVMEGPNGSVHFVRFN